MSWAVFIAAGILAALAAAALATPVLREGGRRSGLALVLAVPLLSLALYLALGRPGLPGQAQTEQSRAEARREAYTLLAQKPFNTLKDIDRDDLGALTALGDISMRLGEYKGARKFYSRALEIATARHDPHTASLAAALERANAAH